MVRRVRLAVLSGALAVLPGACGREPPPWRTSLSADFDREAVRSGEARVLWGALEAIVVDNRDRPGMPRPGLNGLASLGVRGGASAVQ